MASSNQAHPETLPNQAFPETPLPNQAFPETLPAAGVEQSDKAVESGSTSRSHSPDQCSICLGQFKDKSFTDSCFHTFCFSCLQEWAKVKPVCPLCKTSFSSVIHNIKSNEDYEQIYLPIPSHPAPADDEDEEGGRRFRYATTLTQERRYLLESRRMRQFARDARREERQRREESANSRRRLIYTAGLRVLHMGSNEYSRFRDISPQFFRSNPAMTHRLVPWLHRDLWVLFDNQEEHVTFMTHYILSLITNVDIQSEEFHVNLRPFLHDSVEHFVHEFANFARSPYDMETYDQMAQYDFSGEGASHPHMRISLPIRPPTRTGTESDGPSMVILSDHESEPMVISDGDASDQELETIQTGNPARPPVVGLLSEPTSPPLPSSGNPSDNFLTGPMLNQRSHGLGSIALGNNPVVPPGDNPELPREPILPPIPSQEPPATPAAPPQSSAVPVLPVPRVVPLSLLPSKPSEPPENQPGPSGLQSDAVAEQVKIKEEPPDFHDSDHSDIEFIGFVKPSSMRTPERFNLSSESESEVRALEEDRKKWQKEKKRRKRLREMMQEITTLEQNMITIDSDSGGHRDRSRSSSYDRSPTRQRQQSRSRANRHRRSRSANRPSRSKEKAKGQRSPSKPASTSWRDKFGYGDKTPSPPRVSSTTSRKPDNKGRRRGNEEEDAKYVDRVKKSSMDRHEKPSKSKTAGLRREKSNSREKRRSSVSRDRSMKHSHSQSHERRSKRSPSHSHDKRAKVSHSDRRQEATKGRSHDRREKSPSRSRDRVDKDYTKHGRNRMTQSSRSRERSHSRDTAGRSTRDHGRERKASKSRSPSRERTVKTTRRQDSTSRRSRSHSLDESDKPSPRHPNKKSKQTRSRSGDRNVEPSRSSSPETESDRAHSPTPEKVRSKGKTKKSSKRRSRSREESASSRHRNSRKEKSQSRERVKNKPKKSKKHSKKRSRSRSRERR